MVVRGTRLCARCGKVFTPPTHGSRARFCQVSCRVLAARARKMGLPELAPVIAEVTPISDEISGDREVLMSLADVARELQHKLRSPRTPPTALAGLAREYRATLTEIEKSKPRAKDDVDELLERRQRRSGA